ncbi:isopenicillin N synthase family dioxygenase [Aurantimicrobium minutum]|uniref:isopenicillin N synthase family dioxygenase n=1 Tax=Aurantimicrobium minutum TaxID=708131 RepID=UPI002476817E|nr:2-oxoglutarate and iron-dependent oxygenase domain-containing protein [Aurantimicrobium minutum]
MPIVDFSLLGGSEEDIATFREQLRTITHEIGFFYLVGHGISQERMSEYVRVSRLFFELPEEEKLTLENTNSPHFRGYTRVGGEYTRGQVDWREQLDIGRERVALDSTLFPEDYWNLIGPNQWPKSLPQLREITELWIDDLSQIAQRLLSEWAVSLGAPADVFADSFDERAEPLLKVVRYPGKSEGDSKQGVGIHKDAGILTLLYVEEGKAGLQVEYDGAWIDAPPVEGAFVVNIGEMLEIATGGYLKATLHRVISPEVGTDRVSIPFFYQPRLDAEIPHIELAEEFRAKSRGVEQDPNNVLHPVFGENILKSRVRAHPNVVEAHHPHLASAGAKAGAY